MFATFGREVGYMTLMHNTNTSAAVALTLTRLIAPDRPHRFNFYTGSLRVYITATSLALSPLIPHPVSSPDYPDRINILFSALTSATFPPNSTCFSHISTRV